MMISDSTTRALNAINDLYDLLRLAQGAAERLEKEIHGPAFDQTVNMSAHVREVRQMAEQLRSQVERFVKEQAAASMDHA